MLFLKKQNQTDALTIDFIFIQIVKNHCAQGDSARIRASAPYHAKTPKYPFVTFKKFGRKFGHLLYILPLGRQGRCLSAKARRCFNKTNLLTLKTHIMRKKNVFVRPNGQRTNLFGRCHGEKRCAKANRFAMTVVLALASCSFLQAKVLVVTPSQGGTVSKISLTTATKLTFSEKDFKVVASPSATPQTFGYANVRTISFSNDTVPGTPNERLKDVDRLRLACNPVSSLLRIEGHDGNAAVLRIAAMNGKQIFSTIWQGEDLDVSYLTPGFYFVTINSQTIKFIKK